MKTLVDKEFVREVVLCWEEHNDPERCVGWCRERAARLMPIFTSAWRAQVASKEILDRLARARARNVY